jgi:glyceraldehyde 3-phosphate dehydrogenase
LLPVLKHLFYQVPTPNGSLVNFVAELDRKDVSIQEANELFKNVSIHHLKGILEYSEEPLVSTDIVGNPHSCIFDSSLTNIIDTELLVLTGWYDNEWGYSNRMIDIMKYIMKR